ncbi:MAG: hypothetical protein ACRDV9_10130, partial [Acidimicrobiia bacterium]
LRLPSVVGPERSDPNGTSPTSPSVPTPKPFRMFLRALRRRCPRCGSRGLFPKWFHMVKVCPGCGYAFEGRPEEGFFLGAYTMNLIATLGTLFLVVFAYIALLATGRDDELFWPMLVVGASVSVLVPVVFHPFSKTLWVAIELWLRSLGDQSR